MKKGDEKMKTMREIIDTWNIIEKYNIKGWKQDVNNNCEMCT